MIEDNVTFPPTPVLTYLSGFASHPKIEIFNMQENIWEIQLRSIISEGLDGGGVGMREVLGKFCWGR